MKIPTQAQHCNFEGTFHHTGSFYRRDIDPVQGPSSRPQNIADRTPNLHFLLEMFLLGTKQNTQINKN